jgi:hypothetical protein
MVEVRRLEVDAGLPSGEAWILVEKRGDLYFVFGRSEGKATLAPSGVDNARVAFYSANAWADLLGVSLLYIREERRPGKGRIGRPIGNRLRSFEGVLQGGRFRRRPRRIAPNEKPAP